MSKNKRIHVTPRQNGWAVVREEADRASFIAATKAEAEKIGRSLAKQEEGELIIHGKDGKIQDADSYGADPFPPRDKKP